jgi:DNA-binding transcriptional LysR family regulator
LLAQHDNAIEATRRAARGDQGRLRLGMTPTAPFHPLVPRALRAYREKFPLVSVALEEALSNELIKRFVTAQIDAAFFTRSLCAPVETLVIKTLLEETMVVALPNAHPLLRRRKPNIQLGDLAEDPFILIGPPGSTMHDGTVAACHAAGFSLASLNRLLGLRRLWGWLPAVWE